MQRPRATIRAVRGGLSSWLAGVMLLAGAAGCSAIVDPDVGKLGGPPPPACQPGDVLHNCACAGGKTGYQVCNSGGSYNACQCDGAGIAGASAGAGGAAGTGARAGTGGAGGTSTGGAGRGGKK
jgi:hypothetical protein